MAIFILAGHHNNDPGAISPHTGEKEADLTKELAGMVTERINDIAPDIETWNDDPNDALNRVVAKISERITNKDIICDIHFNSFHSSSATGFEVIVSNNAGQVSKSIANDLCDIIPKVIGISNRGVKTESQTARGRLAIVNLPGVAVLIETAFLSNPTDMDKYHKQKHWVADEIARILIKHHD